MELVPSNLNQLTLFLCLRSASSFWIRTFIFFDRGFQVSTSLGGKLDLIALIHCPFFGKGFDHFQFLLKLKKSFPLTCVESSLLTKSLYCWICLIQKQNHKLKQKSVIRKPLPSLSLRTITYHLQKWDISYSWKMCFILIKFYIFCI